MNTPEKELSDSLLTACKAAGIESPKYIAQDKDESIYHYNERPVAYHRLHQWDDATTIYKLIDHPPYVTDWQDSLLTWVEPQVEGVWDAWDAAQGEPLADVLARHPEHVADTSKMIPSGIEAMVCDDIAKRQQVGIAKYGTTVAENPLTHAEWLQHAYEECLDMAIYLKRAMAEKGGASD